MSDQPAKARLEEFAAEEEVLHHGEVGCLCEILVDDLDPDFAGGAN